MSVHRTICITLVIGRFIFYSLLLYCKQVTESWVRAFGTRLGGMGYLGVLSEGNAELPGILCGGIQKLLIARSRLPSLILPLKVVPDLL